MLKDAVLGVEMPQPQAKRKDTDETKLYCSERSSSYFQQVRLCLFRSREGSFATDADG